MSTVLHLIDTGGPGGAETVCLELLRGLRDRGWGELAILPKEGWLSGALRDAGFDPRILASQGSFDRRYLRELRTLATSGAVDLVQTHLLTSAVYASAAWLGRDTPVVSTFHGRPDIPPETRFRGVKAALLRRPRLQATCVSESLGRHFVASGDLPRDRVRVIYNGVDTDRFSPGPARPLRQELGLLDADRLVGAVGNLRPSKDYPNLLRAFADIARHEPRAHLVIAGEGDDAPLRRLADELGLAGRVRFLGFRSDVVEILRSLDCFVVASSDEGFSLVMVQAMATGTPVVATRCGGPDEIVGTSAAALLVPPRDPVALAQGVMAVLRDPALAQRLGSDARARALASFSLGAMVGAYDRLYRELLGNS